MLQALLYCSGALESQCGFCLLCCSYNAYEDAKNLILNNDPSAAYMYKEMADMDYSNLAREGEVFPLQVINDR